MREKRTVVWERKEPARFRNESAERIRARMRPNALTRVTDKLVERVDAFGEWVERKTVTGEEVEADPRIQAIVVTTFIVAFGIAFLYDRGIPSMAPLFFGTLGALVLAGFSYQAWHQSHPFPPTGERTTKEALVPVIHGLAGGLMAFASIRVIDRTFEGGMGLTLPFSLWICAVPALVVYKYRTSEKEAEPRRNLWGIALWAIGWIGIKAAEVGASMWYQWLW
jgi:hypothetical protein